MADFSNYTGKLNMILQLEVLNVSFEIGAVLGCREEIWGIRGEPVVGEGSQLSRRDKLW
jgi:hypothetical protein